MSDPQLGRLVVGVFEDARARAFFVKADHPGEIALGMIWLAQSVLQIPELDFLHREAQAIVDKIRDGAPMPRTVLVTGENDPGERS